MVTTVESAGDMIRGMNPVLQPGRFDVVAATNLFGDILSDLGPATTGTIGRWNSITQENGAILVRCEEAIVVGAEDRPIRPTVVVPEGDQLAARGDAPDPHGLVPGGRHDPRIIGTELRGHDVLGVTGEYEHGGSGVDIPDPCRAVFRC